MAIVIYIFFAALYACTKVTLLGGHFRISEMYRYITKMCQYPCNFLIQTCWQYTYQYLITETMISSYYEEVLTEVVHVEPNLVGECYQ